MSGRMQGNLSSLYFHACIYRSFRKSGRRDAHALGKLQRGRLDGLFKEEEKLVPSVLS